MYKRNRSIKGGAAEPKKRRKPQKCGESKPLVPTQIIISKPKTEHPRLYRILFM